MKLSQKFFPVVLGLLLLTGTAFAQGQQMQGASADSVSDEELKTFVETTKEVQAMQQEVQMEMQNMIKEEGLTLDRYQKIMQSKQNPEAAGDIEITPEEENTINQLQPKIQSMGQETQQAQIATIEDNGLTLQRYQQIAQTLRSNPAMMQKVQKMMMDSTSSGDGN